MMSITHNNNNNLYGLNNYFLELTNLYDINKLPNKILLSGKKGSGKFTLAFHLVNYILSKNQEYTYDKNNLVINKLNKSFLLAKNNTHPNFFLIDVLKDKKNIEINQIRELIIYLNKSSFNNTPRLILIDNIEFLNNNSSNAILKILEEPNSNVFFILIHNNKKILSTISSRCLNFRINLSFNDVLDITNKILNKNILDYINIDLVNYYNTPGDYYDLFEFANKNKINLMDFNLCQFLNYLIDNNLFKKDPIAKKIIYNYVELFFLKKYLNSNFKRFVLEFYYSFIKKVNNCNQFNLDEESLFMEFKSKILNG